MYMFPEDWKEPEYWCLFKENKNSGWRFAKIIWTCHESRKCRVTEYGYGQYSHTIDLDAIFTKSTDRESLLNMMNIHDKMEEWENKRFGGVKIRVNV